MALHLQRIRPLKRHGCPEYLVSDLRGHDSKGRCAKDMIVFWIAWMFGHLGVLWEAWTE